MKIITIDRAVVEQALEAMRRAVPTGKITLYEWDKAMSDLDAALAQEQAEPVQEPVAEARYDGTLRWLEPHGVGLHRIQGPLYTAPPKREPLAQEEIDRIRAAEREACATRLEAIGCDHCAANIRARSKA